MCVHIYLHTLILFLYLHFFFELFKFRQRKEGKSSRLFRYLYVCYIWNERNENKIKKKKMKYFVCSLFTNNNQKKEKPIFCIVYLFIYLISVWTACFSKRYGDRFCSDREPSYISNYLSQIII